VSIEPSATPSLDADPAPAEPPAGRHRGPALAGAWHLVERYALAVLLVAVVVFFLSWPRTSLAYGSLDNFRNIIGSQVVLAIIALGSIAPLICGQFDLSVGSVAGMTSVFTAAAYARWDFPLWAGVLFGVLLGAVVGVLNGLLVTRFGVNALITTLGTASVVTGAVNWYTGGNSIIQKIPTRLTDFGAGNWLGLPLTLYLLVAVAAAIWYLLEHTPFGRYLYSVGVSPESARLVGLRIPSLVLRSFVVSGAAAGLAGVMLLARSGAGNPGIGGSFTLTALAAAFLGATAVRPGRFNVLGTMLAIFFLASAITGLTFAGVKDYISDLFTGSALVLAVAISAMLSRRRAGTS
jgi:ribose transport system permease protein